MPILDTEKFGWNKGITCQQISYDVDTGLRIDRAVNDKDLYFIIVINQETVTLPRKQLLGRYDAYHKTIELYAPATTLTPVLKCDTLEEAIKFIYGRWLMTHVG